ncbi:MAG TPA: hypothetical protein P5550_02825 [Bacteroidales bacterium]|nr:hypothetical protein [Bacteroidales bacterium]
MKNTPAMTLAVWIGLALIILMPPLAAGSRASEKGEGKKNTLDKVASGLKFRALGPGLKSGRISDLAVDPSNPARYFVGVACGSVWKTENAGTTFEPVFDDQPVFSIGCVTIDPNNPYTIWVGSGENNSQRSVSWGDGVYRSLDGGKSWKNMGLKRSEHIAKVLVQPGDPRTVWVAAQGPLWAPGGDRGVFRSLDGGTTWENVLFISENTGVTDLVMDPRDPEVLYAAAYQRRRHVWTLINGGPESAIYKTTDGGKSWRKIETGLPKGDVGRIGLAQSPSHPDILYAIIEAANGNGGFFRSTDRGESWEKRNDYVPTSPQYYSEILCDPRDPDKVYSLDTYTKVTEDGGKTFRNLGLRDRHVDDHALWIDPVNTAHLLIGGDGGLYESWDGGDFWEFKPNLPVTQFYRVSVDNTRPFYNIYGGTQDNNSLGGPSRTLNAMGISNADWFVTKGGDGFETVIDPVNPDILYAQSQYGWLVRYDKRSGESLGIKPMEREGEEPYRWNWDSPLLISPRNNKRLYFAANKLFRSEDQGNSWVAISPDLSAQIDRNTLPVMDKVWSVDAVAKNASTSFYGNIVALSVSPPGPEDQTERLYLADPGPDLLIYAGTDDGLIQVTEDGGQGWRKESRFPGVPERTYVSCLLASMFQPDVVYASFDNHKNGDFSPYILRSSDRGKTWKSIASNLPQGQVIYCIIEDHHRAGVLFIGTEFGVFCTLNDGASWIQLKGGLPPIAVRDIDIQRQHNDLVLGTFGRGFYVLDDYTPLLGMDEALLQKEAHLFPMGKNVLQYIPVRVHGGNDNGSQGATFFTAPNPPFGAVFTLYLKEGLKTRKQLRQEREKDIIKAGQPVPYPSWDSLRAEDDEKAPYLLFEIRNSQGKVVRYLREKPVSGLMRVDWDLRASTSSPATKAPDPGRNTPSGLLVPPGSYQVSVMAVEDGLPRPLAGPIGVVVSSLNNISLPATEGVALQAFQEAMYELNRDARATAAQVEDLLDYSRRAQDALERSRTAAPELQRMAVMLEKELLGLRRRLEGDQTMTKRDAPEPQSILNRIEVANFSAYHARTAPTQTMLDGLTLSRKELKALDERLEGLGQSLVKPLKEGLERIGAPWSE